MHLKDLKQIDFFLYRQVNHKVFKDYQDVFISYLIVV